MVVHDYTHTVNYKGFVYTKDAEGRAPGLSQVRSAAELLNKPKKARNVHPLFARGFDTKLLMRVREEGLRVYVDNKGSGDDLVVMDLTMHKMAYVVSVEKDVFFVARHDLRGKGVMYKVHGFRLSSSSEARQLSQELSMTVNTVFKKLKQTRDFVKRRAGTRKKDRSSAASEGEAAGVRMRKNHDGEDATTHLKKFIAQTRISILSGNKELPEEVTADDLAKVDRTVASADDELEDSRLAELRRELSSAVGTGGGEDDDYMLVSDEAAIEYDDSYTDEFARMTMFVHGGASGQQDDVPRYAEVTLDSDIFNLTQSVV